jgi:hypothetical protein
MDVLRRLRSNLIPVRVRFGCPSSCLFFDGYLAELCPLLEIDSTSGRLIFGGLLECEFGGELHEEDDGSVSLDLSVCRGEISLGIEAEAEHRKNLELLPMDSVRSGGGCDPVLGEEGTYTSIVPATEWE